MSYPINYPTPQGANVQIFQEGGTTSDWVKPQGASFVWFTLIGAGGGGGGSNSINQNYGGGSGAVTNCMIPAFLIPDVLQVTVGSGGAGGTAGGGAGASGTASTVLYRQTSTSGYTLLNANSGAGGVQNVGGGAGGTASTSNFFSAAGFFQSIAGDAGTSGTKTASTTTFLSGGIDSGQISANYGYSTIDKSGFFQLQPIIVGLGASNSGSTVKNNGGIGCGGGGASSLSGYAGGNGGDGLVVIITW